MAVDEQYANALKEIDALKLHLNEAMDELEEERERAERFRVAYTELREGEPVEIRMPNGELDEIVGSGGFHVEQMDTNRWFFDLGGCAFFVSGKGVKLTPRDCEDWHDEKARQLQKGDSQ